MLQMIKDLVDDGSILDHRNNIHLCMTPGTKQGITFVDEFDQCRPVFLALLDPFTFGIFFRRVALWCLIWGLCAFGCFSAISIRIAAEVMNGMHIRGKFGVIRSSSPIPAHPLDDFS